MDAIHVGHDKLIFVQKIEISLLSISGILRFFGAQKSHPYCSNGSKTWTFGTYRICETLWVQLLFWGRYVRPSVKYVADKNKKTHVAILYQLIARIITSLHKCSDLSEPSLFYMYSKRIRCRWIFRSSVRRRFLHIRGKITGSKPFF